ncbi:14.7 kDa ribonuclease H-like protein [archaeon HR04]|nr:14.7 kDa ribonuclease H-like protein [archaeon HR04]
MSIYLYVDGASKGNPGDAAIGLIIKDCNGKVLRKYKEYIGVATNNMAEYIALKKGLEIAAEYGKDITVMMDSRLLVKQMRKEYKVKKAHLREMMRKIEDIIARNNLNVSYIYIPREENADADRLANDAIIEHYNNNRM